LAEDVKSMMESELQTKNFKMFHMWIRKNFGILRKIQNVTKKYYIPWWPGHERACVCICLCA
jgi:hypothetical protein